MTIEIEPPRAVPDGAGERHSAELAEELDRYLDRHVVAPRLAASIDREAWGFHSHFDERWQPVPRPTRFLVYQARLAWTAALLVERRPRWRELALEAARHGCAALERMHDPFTGLYVHELDLDGERGRAAPRHLYSQSFALHALAALARLAALGDDAARAGARARELLGAIERSFGIPGSAGCRRTVGPDGAPLPVAPHTVVPPADGLWGPASWSDLNSHLHLVEALAELRRTVVADPGLDGRIAGLLELFVDRFYAEPGCLHLQLDGRLRPVPGDVSYGHEIEAAEILLDAAGTLGHPPAAELVAACRALADHALELGWDPHLEVWTERGGALARSNDLACGWWVAFEALATCSSFAERFPERRERYERGFADTWSFIRRRLTDDEHGGVWYGFDPRGHLLRHKSGDWFATYHAARALVTSADRLRSGGSRAGAPAAAG